MATQVKNERKELSADRAKALELLGLRGKPASKRKTMDDATYAAAAAALAEAGSYKLTIHDPKGRIVAEQELSPKAHGTGSLGWACGRFQLPPVELAGEERSVSCMGAIFVIAGTTPE